MALEKLKECPQGLFLGSTGYSSGGVCYFMSEYVNTTTWGSGSYADAKAAAKASVPATIMSSGKAKNLGDRKRAKWAADEPNYVGPGTLEAMTIYRIWFWFGAAASAPAPDAADSRNHAAIVAVGRGGKVVFFEPNFGFYEAVEDAADHKTLLETSINGLYVSGHANVARNFLYAKGRKLKE